MKLKEFIDLGQSTLDECEAMFNEVKSNSEVNSISLQKLFQNLAFVLEMFTYCIVYTSSSSVDHDHIESLKLKFSADTHVDFFHKKKIKTVLVTTRKYEEPHKKQLGDEPDLTAEEQTILNEFIKPLYGVTERDFFEMRNELKNASSVLPTKFKLFPDPNVREALEKFNRQRIIWKKWTILVDHDRDNRHNNPGPKRNNEELAWKNMTKYLKVDFLEKMLNNCKLLCAPVSKLSR